MRRGEKRRFTVVFSSFPLFSSLFLSFSSLCLRLSLLMVYSAALLALWLWLDLCGSSGLASVGGRVSAAVVLALALLAFRFWL